jgi:hypothetical protein
MKTRPIHENLDTSYVNLSALVRYLRRRQFDGSIRVELSGYEADITLAGENYMRVREHDRIAGRVSEGEEALERLLIRAREPGGIINVYQTIKEDEIAIENPVQISKENPAVVKACQTVVHIAHKPPHKNGNSKSVQTEPAAIEKNSSPNVNPLKLPFEFSNKFEAKARKTNLSPQDWRRLLDLIAELLAVIDKSLAEANLEFTLAFDKARLEIAGDYPFLNPVSGVFDYRNGKVIVREQINAKLFTASINETLRRILEKLGRNPKFSNVHLVTTHKILALIEKRKSDYDKFSITPRLAKIIGI